MLLFMDGFDHINGNAPLAGTKWTFLEGDYGSFNVAGDFTSVAGRYTGSYAIFMGWGDANTGNSSNKHQPGLLKYLPGNHTTLIAGVAWKWSDIHPHPILFFRDGTTNQVDVRINTTTNILYVTRNGTTLGTGTTACSSNTWYYLELKAVFATGATGSVELRIDGVTEVTASSVQTAATSNAYANRVGINTGLNNQDIECGDMTYDDFYVCDATGSVNNNFLGPCRIHTVMPNGAGAVNDFTQVGGTGGQPHTAIDEVPTNGDTDYLHADPQGSRFSVTLDDVPTNITVYAVQGVSYAKKTDAGSRELGLYARSGGSEANSGYVAETTWVYDSYRYQSSVMENDPFTSQPWTPSGINAAEFGMKVVV